MELRINRVRIKRSQPVLRNMHAQMGWRTLYNGGVTFYCSLDPFPFLTEHVGEIAVHQCYHFQVGTIFSQKVFSFPEQNLRYIFVYSEIGIG